MRKLISWIVCGTLVLSGVLAAGTSLRNQHENDTFLDTLINDSAPLLLMMDIVVWFNGRVEVQVSCGPKDWTGEIHNVTFRVTITNLYNNTGSFSFYWRLAEWIEPPELIAWLHFWLTHGNVIPIPKQWIAKLTVNWSATDPDITVKEYIIGIKINQNVAFEIGLWFGVSPFRKGGYCTYQYTPSRP